MKKLLMAIAVCAAMQGCGGRQVSIEEKAENFCKDALSLLENRDLAAFEQNGDEVAAWLETLTPEQQDSAKAVLDQYNDTIGRAYFALERELAESSKKDSAM